MRKTLRGHLGVATHPEQRNAHKKLYHFLVFYKNRKKQRGKKKRTHKTNVFYVSIFAFVFSIRIRIHIRFSLIPLTISGLLTPFLCARCPAPQPELAFMACYLKAIKFSTCLQFVPPTAACQIGQFRWETASDNCVAADLSDAA